MVIHAIDDGGLGRKEMFGVALTDVMGKMGARGERCPGGCPGFRIHSWPALCRGAGLRGRQLQF